MNAINIIQSVQNQNKDTLHYFVAVESNLQKTIEFIKSNFDIDIQTSKEELNELNKINYVTPNLKLTIRYISENTDLEKFRTASYKAVKLGNDNCAKTLTTYFLENENQHDQIFALLESALLSNYQFNKYKTEPKVNSLGPLEFYSPTELAGLEKVIENVSKATMIARDLVNEPVITLTAPKLSKIAQELGKEHGFSVEVFNKQKIESLKMGGLLAVNYGSELPPTFTIMEWKPENAVNTKPLVLVGKGVVYDTGGLSLKPTNSMDTMKSDMGGAAAVIGTITSLAMNKVAYHVIGLTPATDNRPGKNAYTPGDVIHMHSGVTVEVLNTDAEGRMILADALSYAKTYNPELVIDLATLTGSAVVAVGENATAMMGTADSNLKAKLMKSGMKTFERLVELPLWADYKEQLKSDIADIKNVGSRAAGSITAAKFLEHFTAYPWIHLDIAGPAFVSTDTNSYRGKNGTGTGVRLLFDFISGLAKK